MLAHHKPGRTDAELDSWPAGVGQARPGGPTSSWPPRARYSSYEVMPGRAATPPTRSWSAAGPNGLAAAVTLARAGLEVHVIEGAATPGGGCRTAELTLPGFRHDVCSAVHPLAAASPFFHRHRPGRRAGSRCCTPKVAFAHPLDGGRGRGGRGSVEETAGGLGPTAARLPAAARPAGARRAADAARACSRRCALRARASGRPWPGSAWRACCPPAVLARRFRTEEARGAARRRGRARHAAADRAGHRRRSGCCS